VGAEQICVVTVRGVRARAKVLLESTDLIVRGHDAIGRVSFASMKDVKGKDGVLTFRAPAGVVSIAVGPAAARWADKILNPPSRLQKIGVKTAWRTAIVGTIDAQFVDELKAAVELVARSRVPRECDAIFLGVAKVVDLSRLISLKASLKPDGALWVVRPKGHKELTERATMAAGKAAGLVDVKVVAFSAAHTAHKFVIPIAARRS
jgi:hypothetical protein